MSNLQNGLALFQSGEYSQSFDMLLPLAEEGNAEAQSVIGCIYELGLGKDIDMNKAIYWYEKSAAQDHIIALNNLANIFMYLYREGLIDTNKAVNLYRKAAELGMAPSQYMIGKIYLEGIGLDVNETEAVKWLKLASANDFEPAKTMLSSILSSSA
ncbi:tetratricopeptide repeat protein [Pseudanabaena sp. UWO310]|uniref:tetratricopeptide repeat protein n=1 Tax=Pseudanabaena sp. UWO310 TaxID=2480795 RepID=UPI00115B2D63|nr:tetratricopeptide repeat protein [Pseudanabaena sp. UWO310]TYQ27936.1 sel1 repeat family protein [Pseudanabaena sp. UWO310]